MAGNSQVASTMQGAASAAGSNATNDATKQSGEKKDLSGHASGGGK